MHVVHNTKIKITVVIFKCSSLSLVSTPERIYVEAVEASVHVFVDLNHLIKILGGSLLPIGPNVFVLM